MCGGRAPSHGRGHPVPVLEQGSVGPGLHRPCRARPADRSLVAEDRGVRDQTGPEPAGTRWVHVEPVGRARKCNGISGRPQGAENVRQAAGVAATRQPSKRPTGVRVSPLRTMGPTTLGGRPLGSLCIVILADGQPPVRSRLLPDELASGAESKRPGLGTRPDLRFYVVGATGIEPVTPSVSANPGNRCATRRSPRSPPTVDAQRPSTCIHASASIPTTDLAAVSPRRKDQGDCHGDERVLER